MKFEWKTNVSRWRFRQPPYTLVVIRGKNVHRVYFNHRPRRSSFPRFMRKVYDLTLREYNNVETLSWSFNGGSDLCVIIIWFFIAYNFTSHVDLTRRVSTRIRFDLKNSWQNYFYSTTSDANSLYFYTFWFKRRFSLAFLDAHPLFGRKNAWIRFFFS